MKTVIHKKYTIQVPVHQVWEALVEPAKIKQWSGSTAKMTTRQGAEFSLWEGDVWGKNLIVEPDRSLTQEWWSSDMPPDLKKPSVVNFELSKLANGTELQLTHKYVPTQNLNDISAGWDDYYLGPLKQYLES